MKELKKKKKQLAKKRKELDKRVDQWIETSERTFTFACYARVRFKEGSLLDKRVILQTIGSHLLLKDKKLTLTVPKPFKVIGRSKIEVDQLLAKFEPQERDVLTPQIAALFDQSPTLRRGWDSNPQAPCGTTVFETVRITIPCTSPWRPRRESNSQSQPPQGRALSS